MVVEYRTDIVFYADFSTRPSAVFHTLKFSLC